MKNNLKPGDKFFDGTDLPCIYLGLGHFMRNLDDITINIGGRKFNGSIQERNDAPEHIYTYLDHKGVWSVTSTICEHESFQKFEVANDKNWHKAIQNVTKEL